MRYLILLALLGSCLPIHSQNLVPNGNFHDKIICPYDIWAFGSVEEWVRPDTGTSDYYNICDTEDPKIPEAVFGYQESETGEAYVGLYTYSSNNFYREYVQVELTEQLTQGECYNLYFTYNLADKTGASNNLGFLLSGGAPTTLLGQIPQIEIGQLMLDDENWVVASKQIQATGNETHLTIGNFRTDAETTHVPMGVFSSGAYYYIDSVSIAVADISDTALELGEDLFLCTDEFSITLDSGFGGGSIMWSTGENTPTINVSEEGLYHVTFFDVCTSYSDSIEITVVNQEQLVIEDKEICYGEIFEIELDEDLGSYEWQDGSNESTYTVSEAGTYTVSLDNGCSIIEETFEVNVLYPIDDVELLDSTVCMSDFPVLLDVNEFENGINGFLWSNGSLVSETFITSPGEYSVYVFNDCFSSNHTFNINTPEELPEDISLAESKICLGDSIVIEIDLTDVEMLWLDGDTSSVYLVTSPGIYSVQVSSDCEVKNYVFEIDLEIEDAFELGEDIALCPGDSVLINSPNNEEVMWNGMYTGAELWVKQEGWIVVSYEGKCSALSDSVFVSLDGTAPQIDLPDSLFLCEGDSILLTTGDNSSGVEYLWSTGISASEIYVHSAGTYLVAGSNNCGSSVDSVEVFLHPNVTSIELDEVFMICAGDSILVEAIVQGNDIIWSNGDTSLTTYFKQVGEHHVLISSVCGDMEESFEIVLIDTLPPIDIGLDIGLCKGDTLILEVPILDGTYLWNTDDETPEIEITTEGAYTLEVIGECNVSRDSITIYDLGDSPTIDLGSDVVLCLGDTLILEAEGENIDVFTWSNGLTSKSIVIVASGQYFVEVGNQCGVSSDTIEIEFSESIPTISLGEDVSICQGDSVMLDLGIINGTVSWNTGVLGQSIYVANEGWYSATLSSSCGISTDSIYVSFISNLPDFDLGDELDICLGDSVLLDVGYFAENIVWNTGSTGQSIFAADEGWYSAEVSSSCGSKQDSVYLNLIPYPSAFSLGQDTMLCVGDSIEIELFNTSGLTIEWQDGATDSVRYLSQPDSYFVTLKNACGEVSDAITIELLPSIFSFEFEQVDPLCEGETILLDGFQEHVIEYVWQDNSSENFFEVTQAGVYNLKSIGLCETYESFVEVFHQPDVAIESLVEAEYSLCEGEILELDIEDEGLKAILWENGSESYDRTIAEAGTYFFEVSSFCKDSLFAFEVIYEDCLKDQVYVPNVFTPNDDGINDEFSISFPAHWNDLRVEVSVYSRWGEEVFSSEDHAFTWDGSFKNKRMNAGVYVYLINVEVELDNEIREFQLIGDVTIFK